MQKTHKTTFAAYAMFFTACSFCVVNLFFQVLPLNTADYFQRTLSLSYDNFINLASLYLVFYALMQTPSGILLDTFSIKKVLGFSIALAIFGYVLFIFSKTPFLIVVSRSVQGVAFSVSYISAIYVAAKYLPQKFLPMFIAIVEIMSVLGTIFSSSYFPDILSSYGWYKANFFIVLFMLGLLVLIFIFSPQLKSTTTRTATSWRRLFRNILILCKNKTLLLIFIYSFCTWLIIMSFVGCWLKPFLSNVHSYPPAKIEDIIQIYWVSFLASALIIGHFATTIKRCRVALLSLAIIGAVNLNIMAVPVLFNFQQLILVAVFGGMSTAGVVVGFAVVAKIVPANLVGTATAMNNTFVALGGYAGQIIFGLMLHSKPLNNLVNSFVSKLDFCSRTHCQILTSAYSTAFYLYPLSSTLALFAAVYVFFNMKKIHSF